MLGTQQQTEQNGKKWETRNLSSPSEDGQASSPLTCSSSLLLKKKMPPPLSSSFLATEYPQKPPLLSSLAQNFPPSSPPKFQNPLLSNGLPCKKNAPLLNIPPGVQLSFAPQFHYLILWPPTTRRHVAPWEPSTWQNNCRKCMKMSPKTGVYTLVYQNQF